jgi:hypothetical protein
MNNGLKTGVEVYTRDGDRLGEVKELRGEYFKVNAPMAPDYWLSCDSVLASPGVNRVEVTFNKDDLGNFKRDID